MKQIPRYARQTILPEIGRVGQDKLGSSRIVVAGCGALGSTAASMLARSGVGFLRLLDRDIVELHNLQRQELYTEADAAAGVPKAAIAAERLGQINSEITVEPQVVDLNPRNAEELLADVDVIVDAVDNFETRYLINDVAVKHGIPWVYGGVIGVGGVTLTVLPGDGPCLRCLFPQDVAPGDIATCDTAGILSTVVHLIAALQVTEALKLAMGKPEECRRELLEVDAWSGETMAFKVARREDCPVCAGHSFAHLEGRVGSETTSLCGRDAIQIRPQKSLTLDLPHLAGRLRDVGEVVEHPMLVRVEVEGYQLSIFRDGRTIVHGARDETTARTLFARYVGL